MLQINKGAPFTNAPYLKLYYRQAGTRQKGRFIMIRLRDPEYVLHVFTNRTSDDTTAHQFLFVFQGDYYSHSLFLSFIPVGQGIEMKLNFCYTNKLLPDQVQTTKTTIGAALWYRYNKNYDIQDNISMILDDDEEIEKISFDTIINENLLKIKK